MKKLIDTIKNIFKIEELRKRIVYTVLLILVYRLGCFIVVPGIDPTQLDALQTQAENNGLLGLLNMFSGGAFSNASIFALGVMPYISASIVIQLMGIMVPYFQRMQREGESGRRKMNQWTRYLTIVILALQGPAYLTNLHAQLPETAFLIKGFSFNFFATIVLIGGTMFIMWQRYIPDHYDRYHCEIALCTCSGVRNKDEPDNRKFLDAYCRVDYFVLCLCCYNCTCARYTQDSGTVR